MGQLNGKVALITGAGRGIGKAIAYGFAEEGADIAVTSRTRSELEANVARIEVLGRRAISIDADLADPGAAERIVREVIERLGKLDVLVSNAAAASVVAPVIDVDVNEFQNLQTVNLIGTLRLLKAAGPHMLDRGSGKVIIVSSTLGLNGNPTSSAYGASKAALNHLTKTVAWEWGSRGINVNALLPGPVATERVQHVLDQPEIKELILDLMAIRDYPVAEDMVGPAMFLASDMSRMMTGQLLVIDNGISAVAREAGLQPRSH